MALITPGMVRANGERKNVEHKHGLTWLPASLKMKKDEFDFVMDNSFNYYI